MFPQLFGKYVLEREIAAGGMARVYLATLRGAVGFEKRLVVKQIRAELASDAAFVARFVEEAKTAVELSHPNIVPVYELGVEQGVYYIAMELCEGLTLSELLAHTGPLGPAEGAYLGAEICRALDYAHRRAQIVHRDVTPRNVLIDDEGAVRLIDFGIAAPVTQSGATSFGEVFGSPGHMPPEQLRGAALTPATDVFAVGALLIEAWTGHPPFRRATAAESERALFEVLTPIEARIPLLSPLSALIASSVALDPRERPRGAEQLARPLREFLKREDSGDIERRLADRVHQTRRLIQASALRGDGAPRATSSSSSTCSSNPSLGPAHEAASSNADSVPATRTFAARDDLQVWTRKLASVRPAAASPLAANAPRADPEPSSTAQSVIVPAGSASKPDTERHPARLPWLVAGVSCVALLALFSSRAKAPVASSTPTELSRVVPALAPTPSAAPLLVAPQPTSALVASAASAQSTRSAPPSLAAVRARSGAAIPSAAPDSLGELKITADPRAQVAVTGVGYLKREQSPLLGLKVPVGSYDVVFRNDTFGAPLSARVTVVAGGTRSVHADFRRAEPTIVVH